MVWGARIAGIFFLADDYIDSGKMLDRIPGFKKAATGEGVSICKRFVLTSSLTETLMLSFSPFTLKTELKSVMTSFSALSRRRLTHVPSIS